MIRLVVGLRVIEHLFKVGVAVINGPVVVEGLLRLVHNANASLVVLTL